MPIGNEWGGLSLSPLADSLRAVTRTFTSLQRLSAALLHRGATRAGGTDWWAVLVELMVVVLGILIAFQLDGWGKRWEAERSEQALLKRLEVEAKNDLSGLKLVRDQHIESAANYRFLARTAADPATRRGGGSDSCNLLRFPAVRRHAGGALGQAAGERGDLVSDSLLRQALRRAEAERSFNDSQLIYFRDSFHRYAEQIEPHMIWSFGPTKDPACKVDVDSLRADPAAMAILPKLYRDQRRFAIYRQLEVEATATIIDRLACLRGGRCKTS